MNAFEALPVRERVIVALDCEVDEAFALADALSGHAVWMKVGMTLFYANGPAIVYALKEHGFKVFLDLKFHDIPHQVEGAAASAAQTGADMITMHTMGGLDMMAKAKEGATRAAAEYGFETPVTLGITVLTSIDKQGLEDIGISRDVADQVRVLARDAQKAGLSGVVASPQEALMLREALGPDAYIVTPGVRPAGSEKGDQSRIATPAEALGAGASHIVVGRPITQAKDPLQAFEDIVASIVSRPN